MTETGITIYDVARESGVSYGTVSRALNDRYGISRETREHVLAVAERLGYTPNALARGLAARSSASFGIVVPGIADPFFAQIIEGVHTVGQQLGYTVMLANTGRRAEAVKESAIALDRHRVSGIMILGGSDRYDPQIRDQVSSAVVVGLRRSRGGVFPAIYFDHAEGVRMVVRHLSRSGRRRICFVTLNDSSVASAGRLRGYRKQMAVEGLTDYGLVIEGGYTAEHGRLATERILENWSTLRPDAIAYATDTMALAGIRSLLDAGRRIPQDVAVTGYGDTQFAALQQPSLTTVAVDVQRLCETAGSFLQQVVSDPRSRPADVKLEVRLVVRASG